jgi:alcohol dehydrogenase class IV
VKLSEVGIGSDKHEAIVQQWMRNKAEGNNFKLTEEDYRQLIRLIA